MDLTDTRYGKILVLKQDSPRWVCRCDCGTIFVASEKRLLTGWVKACRHCVKSGDYPHLTPTDKANNLHKLIAETEGVHECQTPDCTNTFKGTILRKFCDECRAKRKKAQTVASREAYKQLPNHKGGKR